MLIENLKEKSGSEKWIVISRKTSQKKEKEWGEQNKIREIERIKLWKERKKDTVMVTKMEGKESEREWKEMIEE